MYQRYAAEHGWRVEVESLSEDDAGGYKEIIASIEGEGVFGRVKFESGVHPVPRAPDTLGKEPAPEPHPGDEGAAGQRAPAEARRPRRPAERGAQEPGGVGGSLRANPHLQLTAGPGDRPPDQLTLYNLPKVIEGEALDDVINPLIAEDQAARLASLEESLG